MFDFVDLNAIPDVGEMQSYVLGKATLGAEPGTTISALMDKMIGGPVARFTRAFWNVAE